MVNYCQQCGNEVTMESKFCEKCGSGLESGLSNSASKTYSDSSKEQYLNKDNIKKVTINYWEYVKRTLKSPTSSLVEGDSINGLIQISLITFFQVLTAMFIYSDSYVTVPLSLYLLIFIYLIVFNFIPVVAIHVIKSSFYKSQNTFSKNTSQFGGLLSIFLILQFIIMILSLFLTETIALTVFAFFALSFVSFVISFSIYLYSFENKLALDNLYIILLGFILIFLLMLIWTRVFNAIGGSYIENVFDNMYGYRYYW